MKKVKEKSVRGKLIEQNREEVLLTMYKLNKMNKRSWLTPIDIMRKACELENKEVIKGEPTRRYGRSGGWRWFDWNDRTKGYIHGLVTRKMVRMFIIKRKIVYKLNKKGRDHVEHSLKNILRNIV